MSLMPFLINSVIDIQIFELNTNIFQIVEHIVKSPQTRYSKKKIVIFRKWCFIFFNTPCVLLEESLFFPIMFIKLCNQFRFISDNIIYVLEIKSRTYTYGRIKKLIFIKSMYDGLYWPDFIDVLWGDKSFWIYTILKSQLVFKIGLVVFFSDV